ncbi:hypothetical protein [Hyphobacterium marinum]|uniref:Uncharacterized protein n=1 Tax=Hyphobacterium marinum TaxID=3116574 RepID=A0ABU7LX47_9PROT|nr:hypothetical protein [Hyphobacterium sp. Y6023]MEE2566094.1 hypothetical protein [Hyphobacterium sp. Y6023]
MTNDIDQARENLAFMRALADSPTTPNRAMGQSFLAAGLIYGFQTLVQWGAAVGLIPLPSPFYLVFVIGCTVLFLAVLAWIIWSHRNKGTRTAIGRAYEAAFMAAGLINLSLVTVFIVFSIRDSNVAIWDYYTPILFIFQGGAWTIAYRLSRKLWLGSVAAGWFVAAIGLAVTNSTATYVLIASLAMFLLLALPGWKMMKTAADEDAD